MQPKKKPTFRWNASLTGLATSLALALVLVPAYLRNNAVLANPTAIPVFVIFIGMFASVCHVRKWWALFGGTAAGLAVGIISSIGLMTQNVVGIYPVVVATVALFFMLGIFVGGFFEFVFFLHRLVHRGGHEQAAELMLKNAQEKKR